MSTANKFIEDLESFIKNSLKIKNKDKDASHASIRGNYKKYSYNSSFGIGRFAAIPWFAFLNYSQTVQNGIYPVILYNTKTDTDNLEICYGVSEKNTPSVEWNEEFISSLSHSATKNYPKSYVKKSYTINSIQDLNNNVNDILKVIDTVLSDFSKNFSDFSIDIPLNQILYGPPGTGKTYTAKKLIDKIMISDKQKTKKSSFGALTENTTWWQAIAISMYKHGVNKKYKVSEIEKLLQEFIKCKKHASPPNKIWEQLQTHTSPDSTTVFTKARSNPYLFDKTENSEWYLTEQGKLFINDQLMQRDDVTLDFDQSAYYDFITFHQSYSYDDFVEGIRPNLKDDSTGMYFSLNNGIFKQMCIKANSDPDHNYVLVIDEINRGKIAKIFGELITLIEEDKRIIPNGENDIDDIDLSINELSITEGSTIAKLPYSQKGFGVPKNLYIIGTMNTADKSLALLDVALRRRFEFIPMYPKYEIEDGVIYHKDFLKRLNDVILKKKNNRPDYLIGHAYFMGKDTEPPLNDILNKKVIPLLLEYFNGDKSTVESILKDADNSLVFKETYHLEVV